jgi:hypothetical protein
MNHLKHLLHIGITIIHKKYATIQALEPKPNVKGLKGHQNSIFFFIL